MKTSRYSDSGILCILKQAERWYRRAGFCRAHGMSSATFSKWRAKYGLHERPVGRWAMLSPSSERGVRVLEQIKEWRGKPRAIQCDNGPE